MSAWWCFPGPGDEETWPIDVSPNDPRYNGDEDYDDVETEIDDDAYPAKTVGARG